MLNSLGKVARTGVKWRMSSLRTFLFGTPRFERDSQPMSIGRRKVVALLAYLAHTGQPHTREYLATLLWPSHDQSGALKNLRRDLGRMKQFVGEAVLQADRLQIGLERQNGLEVDTAVFQTLLQTAASHSHLNSAPCQDCLATLTQAADLYNGDFMSGFNLSDSPEFDEWQFFERESLRQKLGEALQQLLAWHTVLADFEKGIEYGRRWLALDPLHEPAQRELMKLYAWAGQHSAALRQYENCVQLLEEELGVEPEPETDLLYEAIKKRDLPPPPQVEADSEPVELSTANLLTPAERFVIKESLKNGGHGQLFFGHDRLQDQPVVIKRIRPELMHHTEEYVARFKREAEALRQLNHPNIVAMLDMFTADEQQTIVMEYVAGGSLRELLDATGALPIEQVLDIALELADALSRAHHLGIIHRDLKPDNVLLAEDGTPRLTDFGIARLEREDIRLTPTGSILGSPAYMSPEALRGEPLDARADIWSFGMIVYEMLAGRRPFTGEQLTAIMISILNDPVPVVAEELPDLPEGFAPLLQQMLVKERDGRLSSMRQVAAELEAIRAGTWQPGLTPLVMPTKPQNLPTPATPFVGREAELDDICQLLTEQADSRVLTVVGVGGSGKTRLILAAAAQMQPHFADGVFFVPLAPLKTADELVPTIAESLSLRLAGSDEPLQQLMRSLQQKELLLVMDNFEHLLAGVPLVSQLLQAAPKMKVLASSRERLQLAGERIFGLDGLVVPQTDTAVTQTSHSAVTLFLQQVNLVRQSNGLQPEEWPQVIRICQLVDGMPLALVLAAGWADMLTFAEIGDEIAQGLDFLETDLQDLPARQRSMRAVFDSSWKRLTAQEAAVLPKLALFGGGFTREAAQTICGTNLRLLRQLMNRSLITTDTQQRYMMHELLRQYALEQLPAAEEPALQHRFVSYYSEWMAQRLHDIQRETFHLALQEITVEQGNLSLAWHWLLTAVTIEALDLMPPFAEAWQFYYYLKGPMVTAQALYVDGLKLLQTAAAQKPINDPALESVYKTAVANLHTKVAYFSFALGDYALVDQHLTLAMPWLEESNDEHLLACAYNCWAKASVLRGQRDLAQEQLEHALHLARKTDDFFIMADAQKVLGVVAVDAGDYELTHNLYQKSLALFQRQNFAPGIAMVMHNIGTAYSRQGETHLAMEAYKEGLAFAQKAGYERMVMESMGAIGGMYRQSGDYEKSESHLQQSIEMARKMGDKRIMASHMKNVGMTYLDWGDVVKAKRMLKSGLEVSWEAETYPDALSIISVFARAIAQQGKLQGALEMLLFVQTQKDTARLIDLETNQSIVDDLLAELPDDLVTQAHEAAASLTLPKLIKQIL